MSEAVGTKGGKDPFVSFLCRQHTLNGLSWAKNVPSWQHFPELPLNPDRELSPKIILSFV